MAEAGNTSDDWELCKENVQPLRHGRSFTEMSAAIQPSNAARIKEEQEYAFMYTYGLAYKPTRPGPAQRNPAQLVHLRRVQLVAAMIFW